MITGDDDMIDSQLSEPSDALTDAVALRDSGAHRLKAKEDPASVARDLSRQGMSTIEIQSLLRSAANVQRRSAIATLIAGVAVTLIIFVVVWAGTDAGFTCTGPGLAAGLFISVRGILKLKNAVEIGRVGDTLGPTNQPTGKE